MLAIAFSAAFYLFKDSAALTEEKPVSTTAQQGQVLGEVTEKARGADIPPAVIEQKAAGPLAFNGVSAKSFAVFENSTKAELFGSNQHQKLPIASLTKLMTALLSYENLEPYDYLDVSSADRINVNPRLDLLPPDEIQIINLLEASLVCSANDAARALARATQEKTGTNFVALMNSRAKELGMEDTNFSNPLGFDSWYNYSTVSDLVKLANYTQNLAVFKNLGKKTGVSFVSKENRSYSCTATNKLVGKNGEIEAVKTGSTPEAKGAIIAKVNREGKTVLVILLESEDREKDLLNLADLAFKAFEW